MSEYIIDVEYDTFNGTFSQERREEITRCRDCRYHGMKFQNSCEHPHALTEKGVLHAEPDGFCKWGERRVEPNGNHLEPSGT